MVEARGKVEVALQRSLGELLDQLLAEQPQRARWLALQPHDVDRAIRAAEEATRQGQAFRTALKGQLDDLAGLRRPLNGSYGPAPATAEESRARAERLQAATAASETAYDQALADGQSREEANAAATAAYQAAIQALSSPQVDQLDDRETPGVHRYDSASYSNSRALDNPRDMTPQGPSSKATPHASSSASLYLGPLEPTGDDSYIRAGWLEELDARANRPHPHYTTGIEELDKLLGGGYAEGLHVIGGITGGGKTSLALSIALHNALAGRNVIYATYEQSRLELWARLAASVTGVPYAAIKRGSYYRSGERILASQELTASAGWEELERASRHIRIVEGGHAYSLEAIEALAHQVTVESGAPPLVIVDYLQRMPAPLGIRDARERLGYVAGQLQINLGRGAGCPVIALSSVNRASYRLADLELAERLASLKEAGEIEYTAYTATLLYGLPESKQGQHMSPGTLGAFTPMVLDVVKHREGQPGRLAVKWAPAKDRWYDALPYGNDSSPL